MKEDIKKLIEKSNFWGRQWQHIQGPGGNFSVKNDTEMWIKSSGVLLKEVSESYGITKCMLKPAFDFKFNSVVGIPSSREEMEYVDLITEMMCDGENLRPSMESAFHAILPEKWVFHTHSAGFSVLAAFGEEKLSELALEFSQVDFVFIDQCLPGYDLARRIQIEMQKFTTKSVKCIALQNHGVIWASNDLQDLDQQMKTVEDSLSQRFSLAKFCLPAEIEGGLDFSAWESFHFSKEAIFPDYALFFGLMNENHSEDKKVIYHKSVRADKSQDAKEICSLQALLCTLMQEEFGEIKSMAPELQQKVADMEIEKLRMQQIGGI